jgi:hypothetical protein
MELVNKAIPNYSFESPRTARDGEYIASVESWQADWPDTGVAAALGYDAGGIARSGGHQRQYAYIQGSGGTLTTYVDATVAEGAVYTLTVALGHRTDLTPGVYFLRLLVDGREVAASKPIAGAEIPPGEFRDYSISYAAESDVGKKFAIQLEHRLDANERADQQQGNFDNVRLRTVGRDHARPSE